MFSLTVPLFTRSLSLLRSTRTIFSLSTSNLYTSNFKVFKLVGMAFNLSISNLSSSDYKSVQSNFSSDDYVSSPVALLYQILPHGQRDLIQLSYFCQNDYVVQEHINSLLFLLYHTICFNPTIKKLSYFFHLANIFYGFFITFSVLNSDSLIFVSLVHCFGR